MTNVKCSQCNHDMYFENGFYVCPICHHQQQVDGSLMLESNIIKKDLIKYLKSEKDNEKYLVNLIEKISVNNPNDEMALLIMAYFEREAKPEKFKKAINNYFTNKEEEENFEVIVKFIINNCDYKFIIHLEEVLKKENLIDTYNDLIQNKICQIETENSNASIPFADVFVCYSSNDLEQVVKIVDTIEEDGVSCWYADRNMPKNNPIYFDYKKTIENAIKNCKVFLVITSKNCMYSSDVQWELGVATENNCNNRIEYVIKSVKHTSLFKKFFDGLQWIDSVNEDEEDALEVLLDRINFMLSTKSSKESSFEQEENSTSEELMNQEDNNQSELVESVSQPLNDDNVEEIVDDESFDTYAPEESASQSLCCDENQEEIINDDSIIQDNGLFASVTVEIQSEESVKPLDDNVKDDSFDFNDNVEDEPEPEIIDFKQLGKNAFDEKEYDIAISNFTKCQLDSEVNYYLGCIYSDLNYEKCDLNIAFYYLINTDDIRAANILNDLGKKFFLGENCGKDYDKAFECFIKSADMGNDKAMSNVAACYKLGRGTKKDPYLSASYYKLAADKGNILASYEYAKACLDKDHIAYNPTVGVKYLIKAANGDVARAQYDLGVYYYKGYIVNKDHKEALIWIDKAIMQGSKEALEFKKIHFNFNSNSKNSGCALELDDLSDLDL